MLCPRKIIFERYTKNSNFKNLIDINYDFDIEDCDSIYIKSNQRILRPNFPVKGQIDYDIRLIVDDSLEYEIIDINGKIDTVTSGGRPHDFVIMNNIKSLVVNGQKLDDTKAPLNIDIPTKLGKFIKK